MRQATRVFISSAIVLLLHLGEGLNPTQSLAVAAEIRLPQSVPTGEFGFEPIYSALTFERPLDIVPIPTQPGAFLVAEQTGKVWRVEGESTTTKRLVLDLADRLWPLSASPGADAENGLLGIAISPQYPDDRALYVAYISNDVSVLGSGPHQRLSKFEITQPPEFTAIVDSETLFLNQYNPDIFHNGGDIEFGPDGFLYHSIGDGGSANDQLKHSQRIDRDYFSAIFRMDVDGRTTSQPPNPHPAHQGIHRIPRDNPFLSTWSFNGKPINPTAVRSELYAVGLRNTWRMSFDSETGLLYANDTGQSLREEINLILPGANYQWPEYEGRFRHQTPQRPLTFGLPPLVDYTREDGSAISAGIAYRGAKFPELFGKYLFADFTSGRVGAIAVLDSPLARSAIELQNDLLQTFPQDKTGDATQAALAWASLQSPTWRPLKLIDARSENGATLTYDPESGRFIANGNNAFVEKYTLEFETPETPPIRRLRLEIEPIDPESPWTQGLSRHPSWKHFFLTNFEAALTSREDPTSRTPINLHRIRVSEPGPIGFGIDNLTDANPRSAWAVSPFNQKPHFVDFDLELPDSVDVTKSLTIVLDQALGDFVNIGRFRILVSDQEVDPLDVWPTPIDDILRIPEEQRTPEAIDRLVAFYLNEHSPRAKRRRDLEAQAQRVFAETPVPTIEWIAQNPQLTSFSMDPTTGDILATDWAQGMIKRLQRADASTPSLPTRLSDTGLFRNVRTLEPADGVLPYTINTPFWSDGAQKSRWIYLPPESTVGFQSEGPWRFPTGTIWIKHFEIDTLSENGPARRRLETRALVKTESGAYGVTYKWNDAQTDAVLVAPEGEKEVLISRSDAGSTFQSWEYPARHQCAQCHTSAAGWALGFNSWQLNRDGDGPFASMNQIQAFAESGMFHTPPPTPERILKSVDVADTHADLETRARSYLASNCAQCHQPGAPGRGEWDARFHLSLEETGLLTGAPRDDLGIEGARLIAPKAPEQSVLYQRIAHLGRDHMPPIATSVINDTAVDLLREWILTGLEDTTPIPSESALAIREASVSANGLVTLGIQSQESNLQAEVWTSRDLVDWRRLGTMAIINQRATFVDPGLSENQIGFYQLRRVKGGE